MTIRERLQKIERELEEGTYRPGGWQKLTREIRGLPDDERQALADEVDRVSDALHRRTPRTEFPLDKAVAAEMGGVGLGGLLLASGTTWGAAATVALWSTAFQPLVKIAVGTLSGVRYSHAWLWGLEPRFKMRYGTYLAASRPARVAVQLAGCVGTPIGALLAARLAEKHAPRVAAAARGWALATVGLNAFFFFARLAGLRTVAGQPLRLSSGAAAAEELLEQA